MLSGQTFFYHHYHCNKKGCGLVCIGSAELLKSAPGMWQCRASALQDKCCGCTPNGGVDVLINLCSIHCCLLPKLGQVLSDLGLLAGGRQQVAVEHCQKDRLRARSARLCTNGQCWLQGCWGVHAENLTAFLHILDLLTGNPGFSDTTNCQRR